MMEIVNVAVRSSQSRQPRRRLCRDGIESSYRNGLILTFGGGTNEVQRDIIAMAGMGLPHYKG